MSTAQVVLIVGATRGIGYNLVRQVLKTDGVHIFATARHPTRAKTLQALADEHKDRVSVLELDIDNEKSVQSFAVELKKRVSFIDTAWLVAGVKIGDATVENTTAADLQASFKSNVVGAHLVLQAIAPLLAQSKAADPSLVFLGTGLATLGAFDYISDWVTKATHVPKREDMAYAISKAAMNSLALFWRLTLSNTKVVSIHPGFVKSDLWEGKEEGFDQTQMITAEASAEALVKLLPTIEKEKTGSGIHFYDGRVVPW